jgi:chaperonin GroEL (HSP60 family)
MLPGGGSALAHSAKVLDLLVLENEDERNGLTILRSSNDVYVETLLHPLKFLTRNEVSAALLVDRVLTGDCYDGVNLKSGLVGNMINMGIIDSYEVVR